MNTSSEYTRKLTKLKDYRPPAWLVSHIELIVDLGIESSEVNARLKLKRNGTQHEPLRLDGVNLELLSIMLDDTPLASQAWRYDQHVLEIDNVNDDCVLETRVRLNPAANTTLQGLYLSGSKENGFLLTQCEAQGFRHITFFVDRPDVMATYDVTLRADPGRFPVLLAGGNAEATGHDYDGRHWARFVDPYPKSSYLFALVAGKLESIEHDYTTANGKAVKLVLWSEAEVIDRCHYALESLERAMRWDENTYGRNYDLEVFHVVATHDFNMGAMENKGLNIFNAKYLLADPDSTTDDEYRAIEAVVAHEYFHNWSGNRVTCRDWFQLSLKEGFTVFRDQSFSADMHSKTLKRIEDVALLRHIQFTEDAGPLAHPVRPSEYLEINNFYTATVYDKGAELVRMLASRLGDVGFRRGTDLYFERHDGQAVTIEDFLTALGDANHLDLSPYLAWYSQSGTPQVQARGVYNPNTCQYILTLTQHLPADTTASPLPIPVRLSLFSRDGDMLPLHLSEQPDQDHTETVVILDQTEQRFIFDDVASAPIPSLLRGFSAPVILNYPYAPEELAVLLTCDVDGFNRWEASQHLATHAFQALHNQSDATIAEIWRDALATLFDQGTLEHALLARLLTPPGEEELADRQQAFDPDRIHTLRQTLLRHLATRMGSHTLSDRYHALHAMRTLPPGDKDGAGARRLKQRILDLIALIDPECAYTLAANQYDNAPNMTDRINALELLVRAQAPQSDAALSHFRARFNHNALALGKWFMVQARIPGEAALERIQKLENDPQFSLKNPNRVQSLLGTFTHANLSGFHRVDGAGYQHLADRLVQIDALNPQLAARLAKAFNPWKRLEKGRRQKAHQVLTQLQQHRLSPNLDEIIRQMLQG